MLKTTLRWTMHINTDKRRFEDAFYKMIKYENHPLSIESGVNYQGKVYSNSKFFLQNVIHDNSMHLKYDRLDGEIIEDANGLLLKLTIQPYVNPLSFYTKAIAASVLLSYLVGGMLLHDITGNLFLLIIGVISLPMFFVALWLMKGIKRITDLGLKGRFNDVLIDVKKEAERGGHIPVY